jgi:hypothetical protein
MLMITYHTAADKPADTTTETAAPKVEEPAPAPVTEPAKTETAGKLLKFRCEVFRKR